MALQRTFSGFPTGYPGVALLLLRLVVGGAASAQAWILITANHGAVSTSVVVVASLAFFPGLALVAGRQHWTSADTPWTAIAIGIALTALILWLHPMIFGGNPLGI